MLFALLESPDSALIDHYGGMYSRLHLAYLTDWNARSSVTES